MSPAREAFEGPLSLSREDSRDSAGAAASQGGARGSVLGMGKGRGRPDGPGSSRIPRPRKAGVQGVGAFRNGMGAGKGGQGISAYVPRPPVVGGSSLARPRPMATPPREPSLTSLSKGGDAEVAQLTAVTVPKQPHVGAPPPQLPATPPPAHRQRKGSVDGPRSPRGGAPRPPTAASTGSSGGRSRRSTGGASISMPPLSTPTSADKDPRPPPSLYGAHASVAKAAARCALTPAVLPSGLSSMQGLRTALLLRLALHLRCVGQFAFACVDAVAGGAAAQSAFVCTGLYAPSARELLQLATRELLLVCALDEGGRGGGDVSLDADGAPMLTSAKQRDPTDAPGADTERQQTEDSAGGHPEAGQGGLSDEDTDSEGPDEPHRPAAQGTGSPPLRIHVRPVLLPSAFVLAARTGVKQAVMAAVYFSQALLLCRQHDAAVELARGALRMCGVLAPPSKHSDTSAPASPSLSQPTPLCSPYGIRFRFGSACANKALGIALACSSGNGLAAGATLDAAKLHLAAARSQFRSCGSRHGEALSWAAQGYVLARLQNVHGAQRCFKEALTLAEAAGLLEAQLEISSQLATLSGKAGDRESASHLHAATRRLRGRLHDERVRMGGGAGGVGSDAPKQHLVAAVLSRAPGRFAAQQQAAADALASTAARRGELPTGLVSRMQYGGGVHAGGGGGHLQDIPFDYVPSTSEAAAFTPRSGVADILALALEVPVQPPSLRGQGASKRVAMSN